jgi:hypothetical protein
MKTASFSLALLLAAGGFALVACGDDAADDVVTADGGTQTDGGVGDAAPDANAADSSPDAGNVAADAAVDAGPLPFLDATAYAAEVSLAANFPFGVVHRYTVGTRATGAVWGRHGGPMISDSFAVSGSPNAKRGVARVAIPATGTTATFTVATLADPSNVPAQRFAGLGLFDLPTAPLSLDSYTASGAGFPGELLGYDVTLQTVTSRAKVNGFFDGVGVATAGGDSVVYAGLSPLSAAASSTSENALYVSKICNGALVPSGNCPAPRKLITWSGSSGPVAADADGNVFVAASYYGNNPSDVVYGAPRANLDAVVAPIVGGTTGLTDSNASGVRQLAAAKPVGANKGWLVVKLPEYEGKTTAYAQAYTAGTTLATTGSKVTDAITYGSKADAFSVFTDASGNLWISVDVGTTGVLLELRSKP